MLEFWVVMNQNIFFGLLIRLQSFRLTISHCLYPFTIDAKTVHVKILKCLTNFSFALAVSVSFWTLANLETNFLGERQSDLLRKWPFCH